MTKQIQLNDGTSTTVDDKHYEHLSKFNWLIVGKAAIHRQEKRNPSKSWRKNCVSISIANEIFNTRGIMYDHKDRNFRNNIENNLRAATQSLNLYNRSKKKNTTSKFTGVSYRSDTKIWRAYIKTKYSQISLGCFNSELDAAKAYNKGAIKLSVSEFANLNKDENGVVL